MPRRERAAITFLTLDFRITTLQILKCSMCLAIFLTIIVIIRYIFMIEKNNYRYFAQKSTYVINTSGCKIPKLDPFHPSIRHLVERLPDLDCGNSPLLTVVNTTIRVNSQLYCCARTLSRKSENKTFVGNETCFVNGSFLVTSEFVQVECAKKYGDKIIYRQFYPFVIRKPNVEKRIEDYLKQKKRTIIDHKFRIMMLGLDSMSKNQFLRHMIKTYEFIKQNLTYVELYGYNKVGKSTYDNIVPMFTGMMAYEAPNTSKFNADVLPLIWNEYMENGYRTMFSEDFVSGATFNHGRKGFGKQPVDYYLRPWSLIVEPHIAEWKTGCLNDRVEADVIFRWMEDLFGFFPEDPLLAITFLTRMSHDYINNLSYHDKPVRDLLERMLFKGHFNNTIFFLFGDHGHRYGTMRRTYMGRMEGRLPVMFIMLPPWFPVKYPVLYNNLKINENRLTTPLDIYATLKDLLYFRKNNKNSKRRRKGRSISLLRTKVPRSRTCADANIKIQWCACVNLKPASVFDPHVLRSAKELVEKINYIISARTNKCAKLTIVKVLNASKQIVDLGESLAHDGFTNFLVSIKVAPSNGIFEGSVWFNGKYLYTADTIERVNAYRDQSWCIDINELKPFCYCMG